MAIEWDRKSDICGEHRPYKTRADAQAMTGWHLRCPKCRRGKVLGAFLCSTGRHWHVGHNWPSPVERRLLVTA